MDEQYGPLQAELDELVGRNLKKNGQPRANASEAGLNRIAEIKQILGDSNQGGQDGPSERHANFETPVEKPQQSTPKGIPSVEQLNPNYEDPATTLNLFTLIEMKREDLSRRQVVYLERQLRVFVKKAGGFRKGLTPEKIDLAKAIMKALDRKKPEWDEEIPVPGFVPEQGLHV